MGLVRKKTLVCETALCGTTDGSAMICLSHINRELELGAQKWARLSVWDAVFAPHMVRVYLKYLVRGINPRQQQLHTWTNAKSASSHGIDRCSLWETMHHIHGYTHTGRGGRAGRRGALSLHAATTTTAAAVTRDTAPGATSAALSTTLHSCYCARHGVIDPLSLVCECACVGSVGGRKPESRLLAFGVRVCVI